ncbi:MAG: acetate--CoA ligase [Nitrososphaeria archaeon]|nr:acetate--CoA ligase [Nitrososphaeria archaeon]
MSNKDAPSESSLEAKTRYYGHKLMECWRRSFEDLENFWSGVAENLSWYKRWDKVLEWNPPFAKWFVGGAINASYNVLDVNLKKGLKNKVAIFWEGEEGATRTLTYYQLWKEVNKFANVLKRLGIKKGDRVSIYLPMVPELPIAMLACARIGAIHSVVFSGFSASALADRINDAEAKLLITADGMYRRGKALSLKGTADEALSQTKTVEKVVLVRRAGIQDVPVTKGRDYWWDELMKEAEPYCEPEPMEATDPLFILYTSGTTGKPKGVVHSTGGYLVWVWATLKWAFNPQPDDIWWCTADIGWITGHSYVTYGPLLHGLTQIMYDGAPDYPAPDRWWEIVERYGVTAFYTAPTAIRMHMKFGEEWARKHDLSTLRILGSVGEPINPEAWKWYHDVIGNKRCPIIDTWWQTETGGFMISPAAGIDLVPLKPGSATFSLPGVQAEVVNEEGEPVKPFERGYLVILAPWPGMMMTLWRDPERYISTYWSKFQPNKKLEFKIQPPAIYYTGDYAMKDDEGYFWLMGRADDVIKVAGHRIGTAELESAFVSHPAVAEAAVVGKPDPVKGEAIVAFLILKLGHQASEDLKKELVMWIRKSIGPVATPDEIYFVQSLPKTRSGKIMRRVLKAVVSGGQLGDVTTLEDASSIEEAKMAVEMLKRAMEERR